MEVLPVAGDSSVLVYVDYRERHEGDPEKHQFSSYDAQLRPRWRTRVHLPAGTEVRALAADGATPYALCTDGDPRALVVIGFAPVTGAGRVFRFVLPVAITPLSFEVSGSEAYVVATAYRQQTVVRLPLRDSAAGQFLPILSSPVTSVTDAVPEPGGLTVLTAERLASTSRLLLRPFRTGEVAPSALRVLQGPYPANLTSGRTVAVPDPARPRLVVGTYATHDPRYAQGVFSTVLTPETAPDPVAAPIFYYDLPTLPHYYDRFGPRRRIRAAARARRRHADSRDVAAHARLLLHRPLPLPDGGAALVAEQYYPRYRSGDSWRYRTFSPMFSSGAGGFAYGLPGLYGVYDPTTVWDRGLDGYVYTQALVFVFDAAGRLRWQHTFVLGNLTRPDLRPYVAVTVLPGGALGLVAPSDNGERRRQLTLTGAGPAPATPLETPIFPATPPASERLLDLDDAQTLPWRPGHVLSTSFQRIRPAGKRARQVFVIEEVTW